MSNRKEAAVTGWRHRLRSTYWFRRIQWLLLVVRQLGILGIGLIFSEFLGLAFAELTGLDRASFLLALLGFLLGLILTGFAFAAYRRRTRQWEVDYEIALEARREAERRIHPTRARCKRVVGRVFLWSPSALAALALFFFPVASHLVHPSSRYLRYYRVPVPWNMLTFSRTFTNGTYFVESYRIRGWKGRWGIMTIGDWEPLSSEITFESLAPNSDFGVYRQYTVPRWASASRKPGRQFRFGPVQLMCWEYTYASLHWLALDGTPWEVIACTTPDGERERNLFATFRGGQSDATVFYGIVERIQLID